MKPHRGASLIEIIVSLAVFSLVLLSLSMIMNAGYNQYWTAAGSLEVQKAALYGTNLLVKELTQSNIDSVDVVDGPPYDSTIFALPEDLSGNRHYTARGVLEWHSFVAYHVQDVNGQPTLVRYAAANPSPSETVPPLDAPDRPDLAAILALPGSKVILTGVGAFEVEKKEDLVRIALTGVFEQRGTFTITVRNQAFPRN